MSKLAQMVLGALALTLVIGVGSALADGVDPPAKCGCHRVHKIHIRHVAPPSVVIRERVVIVHDAPPPCDGVWRHGEEGRWECVMPVREETVGLNGDFFEGDGGVGPDAIIDSGGGGGGGGFAEGGSEAFASASASASASANVRISAQIREHNRMMHQHMHGHSSGCGCSTSGGGGGMHGKW